MLQTYGRRCSTQSYSKDVYACNYSWRKYMVFCDSLRLKCSQVLSCFPARSRAVWVTRAAPAPLGTSLGMRTGWGQAWMSSCGWVQLRRAHDRAEQRGCGDLQTAAAALGQGVMAPRVDMGYGAVGEPWEPGQGTVRAGAAVGTLALALLLRWLYLLINRHFLLSFWQFTQS